jgi:hypothetical protein
MMKNIALALLLLPAISLAENVSYVDLNMTIFDAGHDSVDGFEAGLKTVFDGKLSIDVSQFYAENSDDFPDLKEFSVAYALDSFNDGSFYVGAGVVDAGSAEAATSVGYAKLSGNGLDYNVSVSRIDGQNVIGFALSGQDGDSGLGWNASMRTDGEVDVTSVGLSFIF